MKHADKGWVQKYINEKFTTYLRTELRQVIEPINDSDNPNTTKFSQTNLLDCISIIFCCHKLTNFIFSHRPTSDMLIHFYVALTWLDFSKHPTYEFTEVGWWKPWPDAKLATLERALSKRSSKKVFAYSLCTCIHPMWGPVSCAEVWLTVYIKR